MLTIMLYSNIDLKFKHWMLAIFVIHCQSDADSSQTTVKVRLCPSSAPKHVPLLRGHPALDWPPRNRTMSGHGSE